MFPNLITCGYEYWRENPVVPNRQINAHALGSIASGGAARRRQLVGRKSDPLNTSLFLIALTVEVNIPNLANAKQDATSA